MRSSIWLLGREIADGLGYSVRQIDRASGLFTVDVGGNTTLTVTLPYNVSRTDSDKFQNLRTGDYVRLHGVYLNTSRVELRDFF